MFDIPLLKVLRNLLLVAAGCVHGKPPGYGVRRELTAPSGAALYWKTSMHVSLQGFAILTWVKAFPQTHQVTPIVTRLEADESKCFHPSQAGH
jgi:hypothetical protein